MNLKNNKKKKAQMCGGYLVLRKTQNLESVHVCVGMKIVKIDLFTALLSKEIKKEKVYLN